MSRRLGRLQYFPKGTTEKTASVLIAFFFLMKKRLSREEVDKILQLEAQGLRDMIVRLVKSCGVRDKAIRHVGEALRLAIAAPKKDVDIEM